MIKFLTVAFFATFVSVSVVHAEKNDWSGSYFSGGISLGQGEMVEGVVGSPLTFPGTRDGQAFSAAVGHNWQPNEWVYGIELATIRGAMKLNDAQFPNNEVSYYNEALVSLGYHLSDLHLYALAGVNSGRARPHGIVYLGEANFVGSTYGFGMDWLLSDEYFVSTRLVRREQSVANYDKVYQGDRYFTDGHVDFFELRFGRFF